LKKHLPLAALLAATALLYTGAGVLSGRLNLVDDHDYIVQYGHYDRSFNLAGLVQMFSSISKQEMLHDYYRPIYTLVRCIDYRLYGTSPTGYHVTSLFFYLLAVASAYWILRKLVPSTLAAFAGALLFAVHPIHVEPWLGSWPAAYAIAGALALASFRAVSVGTNLGEHLGVRRGGAGQPAGRRHAGPGMGDIWGLLHAKEACERRRPLGQLRDDVGGGGGSRVLEFRRFSAALSGDHLRFAVATRSCWPTCFPTCA